jgi:hypothetical protein
MGDADGVLSAGKQKHRVLKGGSEFSQHVDRFRLQMFKMTDGVCSMHRNAQLSLSPLGRARVAG